MAESDPRTPNEAGPSAYLLRDIVAEGGHGEILEAIQVSLRRVVAVKRVHRKWYEDRDVERVRLLDASFRKEALVTSRLDHPNIVPVYDFGADRDGHPLIAMKLVEGSQWSKIIQEDRQILDPPGYLARHLSILISVAHAVGFAHSRGVIHRDLKPSQVMVGKFGEVFLMDWGLAVVFEEHPPTSAAAGLTMPISLKDAVNPAGTAAYMAPEQTEPTAARLGPWTDIWLLGGLLYSILTGTRPYNDTESRLAMAKAKTGVVEPPEQRAPSFPIPAELSQLCMQALSPDIGRRPANTREFIQSIEGYLSGANRREEARKLTAEAEDVIRAGISSYEGLSECDNQLIRARNLDPEHLQARMLHQRLLTTFARAAAENGDLGLARVQAARVEDTQERGILESRIEQKERMLRRQVAERRIAIAACFVLLLVSGALGWLLIARAARAKVAFEQARAEEVRKQGEITRAHESAEASARQAQRASEVSSLYGAEARLAHEITQDWRKQFGVPPTLEWTPYDRSFLSRVDKAHAQRLEKELDDWSTSRSLLAGRGEKLAPSPFSLKYAAGIMALSAAAGTTDTRRAMEFFRAASKRGANYYPAHILLAVAAFRGGDPATARAILEDIAPGIASISGFRGDFQRVLTLARQALILQYRDAELPPGSIIVESRPGGKHASDYEEVAGSDWLDTNKPAEWAKSAAAGTTIDPPIGGRIVRFYDVSSNRLSDLPAAARFHPHLSSPGSYHVYLTWPIGASAFPVICSVRHSHGETSISLAQDGWGIRGTSNANLWTNLGRYDFDAGADQWVEVRAPRDVRPVSRVWNGQLGADAVLFCPDGIDFCTTEPRFIAQSMEEGVDTLGWYYNMDAAQQAAANAGKNLLVFLSGGSSEITRWYGEVFSDPQIRRAISRSYIPVSVKVYGNTKYAWAFRHHSPGSVLILNADGRQKALLSPADVLTSSRLTQILRKEESANVAAR